MFFSLSPCSFHAHTSYIIYYKIKHYTRQKVPTFFTSTVLRYRTALFCIGHIREYKSFRGQTSSFSVPKTPYSNSQGLYITFLYIFFFKCSQVETKGTRSWLRDNAFLRDAFSRTRTLRKRYSNNFTRQEQVFNVLE